MGNACLDIKIRLKEMDPPCGLIPKVSKPDSASHHSKVTKYTFMKFLKICTSLHLLCDLLMHH